MTAAQTGSFRSALTSKGTDKRANTAARHSCASGRSVSHSGAQTVCDGQVNNKQLSTAVTNSKRAELAHRMFEAFSAVD